MSDKELSIPMVTMSIGQCSSRIADPRNGGISLNLGSLERNVILTQLAEMTLKDLNVKNYLFASIDKTILKTIKEGQF